MQMEGGMAVNIKELSVAVFGDLRYLGSKDDPLYVCVKLEISKGLDCKELVRHYWTYY